MKKRILAVVLAALFVVLTLSFAGCSKTDATDLEYVQDKGTLVVGITDYPPMDYKEEGSNEWTGFDAEFARLFGEKLDVAVEFVEIDWDNKFFELDSKAIDCIWNGMTITDEAMANASVSDAYVKNAQVVVMAEDKLAQYATVESIKDLTFACESGSAGEDALEAAGLNFTAVLTQTNALMEVESGAADACVIDITMADAMTKDGASYADYGYSIELTSEEYGIAFRQGSDLTAAVNSYMDEIIADGTLGALAEKYELTLVG